MSLTILVAVLFALGVFVAVIFIARQLGSGTTAAKRQNRLLNLMQDEQNQTKKLAEEEHRSILLSDAERAGRFLLGLPGGKNTYDLLVKAGMKSQVVSFLLGIAVVFVAVTLLAAKVGGVLVAVIGGLAAAYLLPRAFIKYKIKKRNETFINMFPDAVDMIVRSVKSGHPLNTALRMIAENMDPPVSAEFRKVVDEIAFGRSTTEALVRLSKRIDEPDLQFFVVILSVQQETGGNLAEVLGNLSNIIRKRKQLRLKIKALTSEGRATAYILGALPFVVFGALQLTSPGYLAPLFVESMGQIVLGSAIALVALAAFIVYNMLQIDI